MRRWLGVLPLLYGLLLPLAANAEGVCANPNEVVCGDVVARQSHGDFHGLIMVRDDPSVLDRAAHSGTQPGCGDCVWEVILACPENQPGGSQEALACSSAANRVRCPAGQQLYRLFLTTAAVHDQLAGSLCLGGIADVIPVGNVAAADVDRYLRDVRPPDLTLSTSPSGAALTGLPEYVMARPPTDLAPQPFGGPLVRETITLTPQAYLWTWGDGTSSGWTTDAGDLYPHGTLTHTYARSGTVTGQLSTRWGGSYTVTVAGLTFGPYAALGTVTHDQPFTTTILDAHSRLVSHG